MYVNNLTEIDGRKLLLTSSASECHFKQITIDRVETKERVMKDFEFMPDVLLNGTEML